MCHGGEKKKEKSSHLLVNVQTAKTHILQTPHFSIFLRKHCCLVSNNPVYINHVFIVFVNAAYASGS